MASFSVVQQYENYIGIGNVCSVAATPGPLQVTDAVILLKPINVPANTVVISIPSILV